MNYIEWQEDQFQLVKFIVLFLGWDRSLNMKFPRAQICHIGVHLKETSAYSFSVFIINI